jgi:hypothetical protein
MLGGVPGGILGGIRLADAREHGGRLVREKGVKGVGAFVQLD